MGCQNFVKQKIESLEDVINVEVSLERGIATINSKKLFPKINCLIF